MGVRTIYGIAAPNNILYPYVHDSASSFQYGADWEPSDGVADTMCCSSAATPIVAGAAALYRQWYLADNGTLINNPGVLYSELLLMGDRRSDDSGSKLVEGYSNLWGAGVLRLRKYDTAGLDGPALHGTGYTCVGNGETVVPLDTSTAVSDDVEYVKATAWLYDSRHDDSGNGSGEFDRVTLQLQYYHTGLLQWVTIRDDADDNNQLRVYYSDPGAWRLRIRLVGTDVTEDNGGCGTNAIRVYWSYLHEDNDRDDDADLANHVRPEY